MRGREKTQQYSLNTDPYHHQRQRPTSAMETGMQKKLLVRKHRREWK